MKKISFLVPAVLLLAMNVWGKVSLPSVISSNMVLQQSTGAALWGKARPNAKVTVSTSWNKRTYTTMSAADGSWKLRVQTATAGGPYEITFNDGEKLTLTNILLGEVWVCSGQSNMEMPVKGFGNQPILNSADILLDAENDQIRLFRVERGLSRTPQFDFKATPWESATPETVKDFSAVGYQYARLLQQKLKVPVGVIMSTWGGTMIEAWMDSTSLKQFPEIKIKAVADTSKIIKNDPTVLFNAMVHPFLGYTMKGVIWYQGEQNRINSQIYDKLMVSMVSGWRRLWEQGEWPFYYVQIAPFKYTDKFGSAAHVREAQLRAASMIPNSGMVVTMDVGAENSIHPPDKTTISRRLALWSLANAYGKKGLPYAHPVFKGMKVSGNSVYVNFDNTVNGLTSFGKPLSAFEIAGDDKVFHPATAKISGNGVTLQSENVPNPVAVRYAFRDYVAGDLYNTEGLPAAPFRTDNW